MSSFAYKCVFYRAKHHAKWGSYRSKFWRSWNAKMKYTSGQSSKYRLKTGVNFLAIMLTPGVMVIKMSKMAHFLYFLLMTASESAYERS